MTTALFDVSSTRVQTQPIGLDETTRHAMIAEAAYFLSESRGFEPGWELEDWLNAEWELDQRLAGDGPGALGLSDAA